MNTKVFNTNLPSIASDGSLSKYLAEIKKYKEQGDKIFEKDGATVIVDKLSYIFMIGSRLDYTESLLASGFALNNPNVKNSCSCGSSVAFKKP